MIVALLALPLNKAPASRLKATCKVDSAPDFKWACNSFSLVRKETPYHCVAHICELSKKHNLQKILQNVTALWFEWGIILMTGIASSMFSTFSSSAPRQEILVSLKFCAYQYISLPRNEKWAKLPLLLSWEAKQRRGSLDHEHGNQRRGLPHPAFLSSSTGLHAPHSDRTSHGRHRDWESLGKFSSRSPATSCDIYQSLLASY